MGRQTVACGVRTGAAFARARCVARTARLLPPRRNLGVCDHCRVRRAYAHALLLELADPCAMTVRQIELADRWLTMWSRKVFPYAQERETEGPVIVMDLDASY